MSRKRKGNAPSSNRPKEDPAPESQNRRRKPITLAAILLGVGATVASTVGVWMQLSPKNSNHVQTTQRRITYQEARADPDLHQRYLAQFDDLTKTYPYIKGIVYAPNLGSGTMATSSLDHPPILGEGEPQNPIGTDNTVYVSPRAFRVSSIQTEDDFLSVLVDHEIEGHARYLNQGFPGFTMSNALNSEGQFSRFNTAEGREISTLNPICELFAYQNQLDNPYNRRISAAQRESDVLMYNINFIDLLRIASGGQHYRDHLEIGRLAVRFARSELVGMISDLPNYRGPTYCNDGHVHVTEGTIHMPIALKDRFGELGARP